MSASVALCSWISTMSESREDKADLAVGQAVVLAVTMRKIRRRLVALVGLLVLLPALGTRPLRSLRRGWRGGCISGLRRAFPLLGRVRDVVTLRAWAARRAAPGGRDGGRDLRFKDLDDCRLLHGVMHYRNGH